jgi:hypothetical protein
MLSTNQNYLDYMKATKGMKKNDRVNFISTFIEENINDCHIYFGSYFQFTKDNKDDYILEPILWRVLNYKTVKENGYLLLLSKYLLDTHHFNYGGNNYKTSDIRKELNGYFYNHAFTKNEQKKIIPMIIEDYVDNVFLLAKEDYENPIYFIDDDSRKASCTDFTLWTRGYQSKITHAGTYWTRSVGRGKYPKGVTIINHYGSISSWTSYHRCPGWHRGFAPMPYETIRPAIKIKI